MVMHSDDAFAPVAYLQFHSPKVVAKPPCIEHKTRALERIRVNQARSTQNVRFENYGCEGHVNSRIFTSVH